ncbi:ArgR family transcriptional regulator [Acerihabitans sp. TG2]|uniref:arginine repressor n=1 Tax=Acerihabitans sp. TG2 TaxID=3096008 RepID=UPI002B22C90E|nr:ArgR family transcriptional regulator [Acerihabitans sp. TG2]MEA9391935.1 ArgR family transcriptional regulator [Acerihabitans sp. TG2]
MTKSPVQREDEQQKLALCHKLISSNSYISQDEIRREMIRAGYPRIGQSSVSRLLKTLGVTKVRNAKGIRVYTLDQSHQTRPAIENPLSAMVLSVEHNAHFVLILTISGYARAIARVLDMLNVPGILGIVAANSSVWVTPRKDYSVFHLYKYIARSLTREPDIEE